MLHLYALFAEYIHILCICTVYIRGTCILSGGMCGLQHTERIHTAKTKSPGPFCEPSGPERVPGFVFALCAGKWPARRAPCAAQQFLLGLGQLLEGIFPPQGGALIRAQFQIGKTPGPSGTGVLCAASALVCAQADGRVGGPAGVQRTACTPHHIHKGGLWPGARLRCGHCSLTPDGRRQERSPYPWP